MVGSMDARVGDVKASFVDHHPACIHIGGREKFDLELYLHHSLYVCTYVPTFVYILYFILILVVINFFLSSGIYLILCAVRVSTVGE